MYRPVALLALLVGLASGLAAPAEAGDPVVVLETSLGVIQVELDATHAPKTVENFLRYVKADYYAGTIFHRVISDFMIQGGGYTAEKRQKTPLFAPIALESGTGLKNLRGTIAMARTDDPNSATCQFFINVEDNPALDHNPRQPGPNGYAVFGHVSAGMDVVDRIRAVPVTDKGVSEAVPVNNVVIKSVKEAASARSRG